jgi:hypothetical protein
VASSTAAAAGAKGIAHTLPQAPRSRVEDGEADEINLRYRPRLSQATIDFADALNKSLFGQCGDLRYGLELVDDASGLDEWSVTARR